VPGMFADYKEWREPVDSWAAFPSASPTLRRASEVLAAIIHQDLVEKLPGYLEWLSARTGMALRM